jgi:arylsulfatase A-like enzyme
MTSRRQLLGGAIAAALALAWSVGRAQTPPRPVLLIVVDGLRPDYVTRQLMPRLTALGQRGIVFNAHHSVFPTVTRVNSSSMSTGAYPESHGLLGNVVYSEKTFATRGVNTGEYEQLEAMEKAEGRLQTAPTLGATLQRAGKRFVVFSAGSSGSALLLNHPVYNGAVVNPEFIDPPSLKPHVLDSVGPGPAEAVPNNLRNKWMVDAYLSLGSGELKADVTALWFGDPDATAHQKGIGSEVTVQALRFVDAEIGRVEDTLRTRGVLDSTDIIVASDHGFSTQTGTLRLADIVRPFSRPLADGTPDIVVTEGAINFRGAADPARVAAVVAELQKRPEVGAIFTRAATPGGALGTAPGTLSFDIARWAHPRASAVMVSANWTDERNEAGYPGKTTQAGVAGHGTSSPFDIHNTLIAAGPDFRERATSRVPTANVDLAPTILTLLGIPIPASMTGRAITEGLRTGPSVAGIQVSETTERARSADGSYDVIAHLSTAAGHRYLDFTEVHRPAR